MMDISQMSQAPIMPPTHCILQSLRIAVSYIEYFILPILWLEVFQTLALYGGDIINVQVKF